MTETGDRRIYSIPPGAGFLRILAEALVDDTFGFGLPNPATDPMALSAVTIYLPTRRAARVLRSEIGPLSLGRKLASLTLMSCSPPPTSTLTAHRSPPGSCGLTTAHLPLSSGRAFRECSVTAEPTARSADMRLLLAPGPPIAPRHVHHPSVPDIPSMRAA